VNWSLSRMRPRPSLSVTNRARQWRPPRERWRSVSSRRTPPSGASIGRLRFGGPAPPGFPIPAAYPGGCLEPELRATPGVRTVSSWPNSSRRQRCRNSAIGDSGRDSRGNRPKRQSVGPATEVHPRRISHAPHAEGDADMPSEAMQEIIDALWDQRRAGVGQSPRRCKSAARPSPPRVAFIQCPTTWS
jgi:hypothetical protein